jgi:cyclic pyranopterin phosphate synthase
MRARKVVRCLRLVRDAARARRFPAGPPMRGRLHDLRTSVNDRCNRVIMHAQTFGHDYPSSACRVVDFRGNHARRVLTGGCVRKSGSPAAAAAQENRAVGRDAGQTALDLDADTNHAAMREGSTPPGVTVSLDSLDDATFRAMNDVDFPVAKVLEGIDAAAAEGSRHQDHHGGEARRQRDSIAPRRGTSGTGHIVRFHRIHGRRSPTAGA